MLRVVSGEGPGRPRESGDRGVADALRSAIARTLEATTRPETRERAADLLDEVARRGVEARDEVARRGREARKEVTRRGQEAGAELAKRGQLARDELAKQLEALEARLASIEETLRRQESGSATGQGPTPDSEAGKPNPQHKAES
jgi:polyhydroxyalkanoate synthesis regulator phasin